MLSASAAAFHVVTSGCKTLSKRQGCRGPDGVLAGVERALQVFEIVGVRDDLGDDEQVDRHTASGVGVEVVGQSPVRGAGRHDQPGEGGGHDGVVGEPAEGPVRRGRGRGSVHGVNACRGGVDVGGGQDRVGGGQGGTADTGVVGWSEAPPWAAVAGPLFCLVGEGCGPVGEVGGAGLAGEVEHQGGQVP